jgi:MHS family alpha-ketoglutarate permease-like MFS transporter
VRVLGVALPYALAVSIFGGSAEYVGLWFKAAGQESGFFWYVSGCVGLSLRGCRTLGSTRGWSVDAEPGSPSRR